jgi:hypothetical protein
MLFTVGVEEYPIVDKLPAAQPVGSIEIGNGIRLRSSSGIHSLIKQEHTKNRFINAVDVDMAV